jgi:ABC-type multidrug transport system fused ATPase/permease subunit
VYVSVSIFSWFLWRIVLLLVVLLLLLLLPPPPHPPLLPPPPPVLCFSHGYFTTPSLLWCVSFSSVLILLPFYVRFLSLSFSLVVFLPSALPLLLRLQDMLNRRLESLAAYQAASKSLNSKKDALTKATGSKIPQLETEVAKAEQREADTKEVFDLRTQSCKQEMEAFENTKAHEMKLLIQRLAQMHMNHELRVLDLWKPTLSDHA